MISIRYRNNTLEKNTGIHLECAVRERGTKFASSRDMMHQEKTNIQCSFVPRSPYQLKHADVSQLFSNVKRILVCKLCIGMMLAPFALNAQRHAALNHFLYEQANTAQVRAQDSKAQKDYRALMAIEGKQIVPYAKYIKGIQATQNREMPQRVKPVPKEVVFVSFSMPESLLVQVLHDAKAHHMPVVLRGLVHSSFKDTASRFYDLAKRHKGLGGLEINPLWYRTFHITQVPAVVQVVDPAKCRVNACAHDAYYVVYGNITLNQALEKINREQRIAALSHEHEEGTQ